MNNIKIYRKQLFLHLDGLVLIPTLSALIKTKLLDKMNIAIRSGHHCAQPLLDRLNISSSSRLSLSFYNTDKEVDKIFIICHF